MFMQPRWSKVTADLWHNKMRTALVVLSIAVGVFAVGMVAHFYLILINSSNEAFASVNPTSVGIWITGFDDELVELVRRMPQVEDADGRRVSNARLHLGGRWYRAQISGWEIGKGRLNLIEVTGGARVPKDRQLLIDQSALFLTDFKIGDTLVVEMSDGLRREMPIVGTVRDVNSNPSLNTGRINSYVTLDTFEWLGEPAEYNQLTFTTVEKQTDYEHMRAVTAAVKNQIERKGWHVQGSFLAPEPGVNFMNFIIEPIGLILAMMAVVTLALSALLVFNTMSALMIAQIKQIGIMKATGASVADIAGMYLFLVVIFGLLAFVVAIFPAAWVADRILQLVASPPMLDLKLPPFRLLTSVVCLELSVSVLAPVLGALLVTIAGSRITIHEAISTHGMGDNFGAHILDRLLGRVRSISGPLILALGDILRTKRRAALTLGTLILSGSVFIGIMSVKASADKTVAEMGEAYRFDVEVQLARNYRAKKIERFSSQVSGVEAAEGWAVVGGALVNDAGEAGNLMWILAPPAGSELTRPKLAQGRWLLPEDENAIVVDSRLLRGHPPRSAGDKIRLSIEGNETEWTIVGIYLAPRTQGYYIAYANLAYVIRLTGDVGQSQRVQLVTTRHDPAFQTEVAQRVNDHFRDLGVKVRSIETSSTFRGLQKEQFNIVVFVLTAMDLLLVLVGGLGLAGTMSISVLERTREIGVMRIVGADDSEVMRIVIVEGLLMGVLSWFGAIVLAWPVGWLLSWVIGWQMVSGPLSYIYSVPGMLIWLVMVLTVAALASFVPAWRASRLTLRDVLAYE